MQEVWREACRHIEITEAAARITEIIGRRLPLEFLIIHRLDRERRLLETVVAPEGFASRRSLNADETAGLVDWLAGNQVTALPPGAASPRCLGPVLDSPGPGTMLAVPLAGKPGTTGVLLMVLEPGAADEDFLVLADMLREPLTTALENDQRLRELLALREAAEADKRTLLTRLGRDQVTGTIVGAETGLSGVMERVDMAARSDVPVLILGETGAGKEVIARAIHERSPRCRGPLFRVNCGAIPPELIDSELFGHDKGSFTGAVAVRRGWFERAAAGTLFLDEVGELTPAAQVRLLRVLQDGSFQRVGGDRTLQADVRVIAATNRDLAALVRQGEFREDLWYRIAVFPLLLPPLRDRREDIPALVAELADRAARRYGLRQCRPTPQQLALLQDYYWPGNVRELGSVIDRAAILGNGERLEIAAALGNPLHDGSGTAMEGPRLVRGPGPLTMHRSPDGPEPGVEGILPLDEAMARHIRAALAATGGRVEGARGAAALLHINPHTLRGRMLKLGIDWARFRRDT